MSRWTDQEVYHAVQCVQDPIYMLDNFAWIDADEGIMPFKIGKSPELDYFYQYEIIQHLLNQENVAILKSRRVGLSWIASFYAAWLINFHRGINVLFLSRKESDAISLVAKVKFILVNMAYKDSDDITLATPADFLKNKIVIDKQQMIGIGHLNEHGEISTISKVTALTTTKRSGQGEKAKFVFVDEVQSIDNQDEVFASALLTAARAGHWMMGSSAGDIGTRFHHICMQSRAKENKTYWYREVWPEEAGIDEEIISRASETLTDDMVQQEWYLTFRQPGNPVFDATHLAACYKPLDMFPEIKQKLDAYRELVISSRGLYKYMSGVDSAMGKAHKKSKDKDYNYFIALTNDGIEAFTYYDQKPLSTWAGQNITLPDGQVISAPGKVSELHEQWPGLCTIEENGPGVVVISRHILPEDGFSTMRFIDIKHQIKSRIIKNLIIAIESHSIVITSEKTYQQLSVFQYGELPDTYACAMGFNDDAVLSLAEAYDGLLSEGGMELSFGSGKSLDTLERMPYDRAYHELIELKNSSIAPAISYRVPEGLRLSSAMPLPLEEFPRLANPRFMANEEILKAIYEKQRKFDRH